MKKPSFSRWMIRQLEERIVYSGHCDEDLTKILSSDPSSGEKMQKSSHPKLTRNEDDIRGNVDFDLIDEHPRKTWKSENFMENTLPLKKDKERDLPDNVVQNNKEVNLADSKKWDFDSEKEEREQFSTKSAETKEEEWREWEVCLVQKRRAKILQDLEVSEVCRVELNELSQEQCTHTQAQIQERTEWLEIPSREELESITNTLLSELEELGWNREKLCELKAGEKGRVELRKLTDEILEKKLYGRGFYKRVIQQFAYKEIIDLLAGEGSSRNFQIPKYGKFL